MTFLQARNAYDADNEREQAKSGVRAQNSAKEGYKGIGLRVLCRIAFRVCCRFACRLGVVLQLEGRPQGQQQEDPGLEQRRVVGQEVPQVCNSAALAQDFAFPLHLLLIQVRSLV